MQKAAKEKTFLLSVIALALFVCAPAIASSNHGLHSKTRAELFLLEGQNRTEQSAFETAKHVENTLCLREVALGSPLAPRAGAGITTPPDPAFPPGSMGAAKSWSLRSRFRAANLPNQGRIRYVPPKNYNPSTPFPRGPEHGYLDRFDNEWIWDPVKGEWDVQLSRTGKAHLGWLSNSGNHVNISPLGEVTH